ncbi:response regulator transcription factor [Azospirillum picis]|uniref:Two-component system OmpR family response regulator n=1 Tax=Azospirillum picis TaxID=488438 RepID=A0ABU0MMR5_9PROT|nr:response regulator transcription factor [Azospirillum picis]MBP2300794.1 two-component system OmpR family response regulator [Azospirillum picis]MDQ0534763.1 two-component system OmpR family response regulator [Azospirillum picis]
MTKILLIDDDPHIRDIVRFALAREGFAVIEAGDGVQGLALAQNESPDLILLDIGMPEMDGTEVCRRLRRDSRVPIIFLSSRDDEIDRILGLELGGDDYVTKPFSPRELTARIKAVLRRTVPPEPAAPDPVLRHNRLRLDPEGVRAYWDETEVVLTATEFGLLRTLADRPGKVFSRDALMDGAYATERYVADRTVDSHIRRVRAKFQAVGGAPVETVHGLGYKLSDCR